MNYPVLSREEGWGIVSMIGLLVVGMVLFIIKYILQLLIRSHKTTNIIGAIITIITGLLLLV